MYKILAFIKSKNGISESEFIDYYENKHSKLIMELFPWILEYKRNYIPFNPHSSIGPKAELPFDVITEMVFEHQDGLDRMLEKFSDQEVIQKIAGDEENFMDRSKTVFVSTW